MVDPATVILKKQQTIGMFLWFKYNSSALTHKDELHFLNSQVVGFQFPFGTKWTSTSKFFKEGEVSTNISIDSYFQYIQKSKTEESVVMN